MLHGCAFCRFRHHPFDMLIDSELFDSELFISGGHAMRYMMFIKHTEDYRMEEVPQSGKEPGKEAATELVLLTRDLSKSVPEVPVLLHKQKHFIAESNFLILIKK